MSKAAILSRISAQEMFLKLRPAAPSCHNKFIVVQTPATTLEMKNALICDSMADDHSKSFKWLLVSGAFGHDKN